MIKKGILRMKWSRWMAALLASLCLLNSVGSGSALDGITVGSTAQFPPGSYPSALVYGPQSAFWFTLSQANAIARLTLPSQIDTFSVPTSSARPFDLTIGSDKKLWFTQELGNKIGRLDPATASLVEFPLPTSAAFPSQITLGQEGDLWFTELEANKIGRITPAGEISEYALPTPDSKPLGIATAMDGDLWFTEWNGYRIGRLTPAGELSEFTIVSPFSRPSQIIVGPDHNLWFTYEIGKKIVRLDPATGAMTTYNLPTASNALTDIAIGPDGRLWFLGVQTVGRFDVTLGGPANLEETPISPIFEGEGRSQIIAGPGMEMFYIAMNSQDVYTASVTTAQWVDLQPFITRFPRFLLAAGEFDMWLEITNWSDRPAHDLQLDLALDESFLFVEGELSGGICSETPAGATCTLASLPGGSSLPVRLRLKTQRINAYSVNRTLSFEVTSAEADYLPANNRLVKTTEIRQSFDYFTDFSGGADDYWTPKTTSSPSGGLIYLGPFNNHRATLKFEDIPPHDRAKICFDLYVLGAWDGSHVSHPGDPKIPPAVIGPDIWAFYLDETRQIVTSFSNQDDLVQAFPASYREEEYPARYASQQIGNFDADPATLDARYRLCREIEHIPETYIATFYGANLDALGSENWALDNVEVKIYFKAGFDLIYLPLVIR